MPPKGRGPVSPAEAVDTAVSRVRMARVRCTNGACRQQASGLVPIREVVPGVLEVLRFACASCGFTLKEESVEAS